MSKNKSKKPWASIFFYSSAVRGIDAALNFLFAGASPIENNIEPNLQILRWRLAKVAFDTVRTMHSDDGNDDNDSDDELGWQR